MSLIPPQFLTVGIFLISAFMGTATGTSMGTVAAIIPIAAGMAEKSGIPAPLILGACVSGAMFGDNLSMISDTTIAATRTQGCELKDKFKMNFLIALPAAILTIAVFLMAGTPSAVLSGNTDYTLLKVLPYMAVLLLALLGGECISSTGKRYIPLRIYRPHGRHPVRYFLCPADLDRLYRHERSLLPSPLLRRYF